MNKLNGALNEINDQYIEEAAKADRLMSNKARIARNIAVPVVSAAAVAGLCIGLGKLGVFGGGQGVDLLPASSDSGDGTTASSTVTVPYEDNDFHYLLEATVQSQIPVVQKTQADIESIIFGSEFPYMLYADEHKAVFTDGIGGVYSFDLASEQITLAIDIADSLELALADFPENYGADSWNGISFFASGDGGIHCSVRTKQTDAMNSRTEYFVVNTDTMTLDLIEGFAFMDYDIYGGTFDLPYDEGYHALSFNAARIGDTDEYVYIRNCTADIDLLTRYDMQLIELRRWSESNTDLSAIAEAMEGGYYPFSDAVGSSAVIYGNYHVEGDVRWQLRIMADGSFSFCNMNNEYMHYGTYEVRGDLVKLTFEPDKEYIVYRIAGPDLIPCPGGELADPDSAFAELADVTLNEFAVQLVLDSDNGSATEEMERYLEELAAKLEKMQSESAELSEMAEVLEQQRVATESVIADLNQMRDLMEMRLEDCEDEAKKADITKEIVLFSEEIAEYERRLDEIQQQIADVNEQADLLDSKSDEAAQEASQVRISEYISRLCRGSDFDGEYIAPYFVNMLDGEWFVSTLYGYDSWQGGMHYGIDIVADMGDPIYAAAGGVARIPDVGNDMFGGNGNTVVIQHDGGYFTVYAHTDVIHVQDGERVEQGQHIADVGSTGWSTGPHLHFAVYEGQTPMDPLTWVWFDNEVFTTNSAAYKIKQAFEENQPKTSKPEDLWYPIDTSYEFSMCPDYGNLEISFNGLQGVAINAMADGEVIYVGGMKYAEGSMIYIAQTDGFVAQYRMVDECIVKVGDHVKAGLKIGQIGEWLEFRIRIADSYTSTLNPDDIVFSTRCFEDDVCGYPTAEDMSAMTPPVSSDKGQIVEMIYGRGGYYEHNGIDIAAEYGTPVYAAKNGEVITAEWGEGGYGFHVKVLHDDGMVTLYAHLSEITVSKGDRINAGAQLGAVGSTGYTTGNALHFEVIVNDTPVDPTEYLTDYPISNDCFVF